MADDKTRTDATESGSDERDADRQFSVTDRRATRSAPASAVGDAEGSGAAEDSGATSVAVEAGSGSGSGGGTGSSDAAQSSGTTSVHSGTGDSGSERSDSRRFFGVWGRLKRPAVLVSSALVLLLAVSTAYLGFRVAEQNGAESDRAEQVAAGEQHALALTSYDFKNLQGNFGAVTENSTDRFGEQYKQVSDSLTKLIEQYQATSRGNVVEAGVISSDDQKAVLSLFVDQSVTNTNSPQPRVDRNRMKMTLVHSVDRHGDDRWLLDDVQLV